MNAEEARIAMRELCKGREELKDGIRRKRWRDAEKALTLAKYDRQIRAIDYVLALLDKEQGK